MNSTDATAKPISLTVVASRPKRGLRVPAALRRWSDPAAYAELIKLSGRDEPPASSDADFITDVERRRRYQKLRERVEAEFREKLIDAEVLASGIGDGPREIIEPSLWEIIDINFDGFEDAGGSGRKYEALEFFEKTALPLNIRYIPQWLDEELASAGHDYFRHDPGYRHVYLGGVGFVLGERQASVVAILHRAALDGDPWQAGKQVLAKAGSQQSKMADVFKSRKDWESLIISDGRGSYRLRLEPPPQERD